MSELKLIKPEDYPIDGVLNKLQAEDYIRIDPETYSQLNLIPVLPEAWSDKVLDVAKDAQTVTIEPSSTSRHDENHTFRMRTLNGGILKQNLPWLFDLYRGDFAEIVARCMGQIVCTASEDEYAVIMNVIGQNDDPYEPHVDSNGATLVLPVTTHLEGEAHHKGGDGELVMSLNSNAHGFFDPEAADSLIIPIQTGHGIVFNGTNKPHYVRLPNDGDRVTLLFNYYTKDASEKDRPLDLSKAIGLTNQ